MNNKNNTIDHQDPFKPLKNVVPINQNDLKGHQEQINDPNWQPIIPAPCDPVKPENASMMWVYRDVAGKPVTARIRFDRDRKKDVLPFTYGRRIWEDRNGVQQDKTDWHYKAPKGKALLYRLDQIVSRETDPILLVEGEKTANAASKIYPDYVVTTSQGGSNAVAKTDWAVLKGRDVVLWGDNDEAGQNIMCKK